MHEKKITFDRLGFRNNAIMPGINTIKTKTINNDVTDNKFGDSNNSEIISII